MEEKDQQVTNVTGFGDFHSAEVEQPRALRGGRGVPLEYAGSNGRVNSDVDRVN